MEPKSQMPQKKKGCAKCLETMVPNLRQQTRGKKPLSHTLSQQPTLQKKYKGMLGLDIFFFIFTRNKNDDENVFGWISIFIFGKNIFPNKPKTGNNKILFSMFSV